MSKVNKELDEINKRKWSSYVFRSFAFGEILTNSEIKTRISFIIKAEREIEEQNISKKNLNDSEKEHLNKEIQQRYKLISDSVLAGYLKYFVRLGILKKHEPKGYSLKRMEFFNLSFKKVDLETIGSLDVLFNLMLPIGKVSSDEIKELDKEDLKHIENRVLKLEKESEKRNIKNEKYFESRYLTTYGLKRYNNYNKDDLLVKILNVLRPATEQVYNISRNEYRKTFHDFVENECKNNDKSIVKSLKRWAKEVFDKKGLLAPDRPHFRSTPINYYEDILIKIKNDNNLSDIEYEKLKEISIKIMKKIEGKYPPIVTVIRF